MMRMEKTKNIIENAFPYLKVTAIESIGKGWNSEAYRINGEYVFRFPKHAVASEMVQREVCLLPKIESRLNLCVPHIEYIGKPTQKFDKYFVGYKEISGAELTREGFDKLSDYSKDKLTQPLVEFLSKERKYPAKIQAALKSVKKQIAEITRPTAALPWSLHAARHLIDC